jgi:transcriptional regulator with XRE-family HTH domain
MSPSLPKDFSAALDEACTAADCTNNRLAEESGVTETTLSRYRNGTRRPRRGGETVTRLAMALQRIARENGRALPADLEKTLQEALLLDALQNIKGQPIDFSQKLDYLFSSLAIRNVDAARALSMDPSYISRIRNGTRYPHDLDGFAEQLAVYCLRKGLLEDNMTFFSQALENATTSLNREAFVKLFSEWLLERNYAAASPSDGFLAALNAYDESPCHQAAHFDDGPTDYSDSRNSTDGSAPLPTRRNYFGPKEALEGWFDFMRCIEESNRVGDLFIDSHVFMRQFAEDQALVQRWMQGIVRAIAKGNRIHCFFYLNTSAVDIMAGLIAWIPACMTGAVFPYYFADDTEGMTRHFCCAGPTAAFYGAYIVRQENSSMYTLTRQKDEVTHYCHWSQNLLNRATPLMRIFGAQDRLSFTAELEQDAKKVGSRHLILTTPPLFTLPEESLIALLKHESVDALTQEYLCREMRHLRTLVESVLQKDWVTTTYPILSKARFREDPAMLSLSVLSSELQLTYTHKAYREHIAATERFASAHKRFSVKQIDTPLFSNIQLYVSEGNCAIVSKIGPTPIHFVKTHPALIAAYESLVSNFGINIGDNSRGKEPCQ